MILKSLFSLNKISRASILLAFFYLLSRVAGLLRDRVLAVRFGASDLLDVYYVSFNLPDLVFNLLVAGAISAAFIPVFVEYQSRKNGEEWKLANNFLNSLLLLTVLFSAVLFALAPAVISLLAPGFLGPKKDLAILFTRVMLFSPLIFSASVVLGSLLQIFDRFLAFAMAPVMYNLGIILGAVVLEPVFGPLGLAEGVVLGALLHLLIQAPSIWKTGWRWQGVLQWGERGLVKIFRLALPRAMGLAAGHINWVILNAMATTAGLGAVTIFNLANNLQYLPIALVGISVAIASFPSLSREALQKDKKEFGRSVERHLQQVVFWVVPFSVLLFFIREEAVRLILYSGNFSAVDARLTAKVLGFFLWGVIGQSLVPVLSRSFYAMHNTKIPTAIGLASVLLNTALAFYLMKSGWGLMGLALAFSVAGIFNAVLLLIYLKKHLPFFQLWPFSLFLGKVLLTTLVMGLALYGASVTHFVIGEGFWLDLIRAAIYSFIALLTFLVFSKILKVDL